MATDDGDPHANTKPHDPGFYACVLVAAGQCDFETNSLEEAGKHQVDSMNTHGPVHIVQQVKRGKDPLYPPRPDFPHISLQDLRPVEKALDRALEHMKILQGTHPSVHLPKGSMNLLNLIATEIREARDAIPGLANND